MIHLVAERDWAKKSLRDEPVDGTILNLLVTVEIAVDVATLILDQRDELSAFAALDTSEATHFVEPSVARDRSPKFSVHANTYTGVATPYSGVTTPGGGE
jgi:hypothetical protein